MLTSVIYCVFRLISSLLSTFYLPKMALENLIWIGSEFSQLIALTKMQVLLGLLNAWEVLEITGYNVTLFWHKINVYVLTTTPLCLSTKVASLRRLDN